MKKQQQQLSSLSAQLWPNQTPKKPINIFDDLLLISIWLSQNTKCLCQKAHMQTQ